MQEVSVAKDVVNTFFTTQPSSYTFRTAPQSVLFCIALCCKTHALCPYFPTFFAVPPLLQYNESKPPSHQIKQKLCMYESTLTGIIRCQFIIQFSDIFVQNDGNFQVPPQEVNFPPRILYHIVLFCILL